MQTFGILQAFSTWYGATIMFIILSMSVFLVALILVRLNFFRTISMNSKHLIQETERAIHENDTKTLAKFKGQRANDPPIRILVSVGLLNQHLTSSELQELFGVTKIRQKVRLNRGLAVFGTFAAIAPFLGLLGTVIGIVQCFNNLAQSGAAGPNVVAAGVAEALWATAAGLVVAIPSVVFYNVFNHFAKNVMTDMDTVSRELMLLLKEERKGGIVF